MDDTLSKTAFFRCTPEMWEKLENIAAESVAKNVSDHIRYALEQYIEAEESQRKNRKPQCNT